MSPRTEVQFEEIRESRRKQIMDAALELFSEHGFHQVSINQIAKEAGISKGLMYNYFESKDELIKTIIYKGIDEMLDNLDPDHDGILEHHELINYIHLTFESVRKNQKYWKIYFALMVQPPVMKLIEPHISELKKPLASMMLNYFEKRGYEDPALEMGFFSGLIAGIIQKYVYAPEYFPLEKLEKRIIEIYDK